jgi:tripartite-type tricarboxylate transporter receptor subunit TctC
MLRTMSLVVAILCTGLTAAQTQTYPDRAVRVAVGFAAGSGPDIQARTVSLALGNSLGQQFYVENRLGANGTIAARAVAQSKPDGYSLLFSSSSIISTPYIYKSLGYDTLTDLRPIATVGQLDGIFMLVDAKSPIKTLADFLAKAKTEIIAYGSPGVGNGLHLTTEIFAKKAGIKLQHIPYRGASEVMTALLGGSV